MSFILGIRMVCYRDDLCIPNWGDLHSYEKVCSFRWLGGICRILCTLLCKSLYLVSPLDWLGSWGSQVELYFLSCFHCCLHTSKKVLIQDIGLVCNYHLDYTEEDTCHWGKNQMGPLFASNVGSKVAVSLIETRRKQNNISWCKSLNHWPN